MRLSRKACLVIFLAILQTAAMAESFRVEFNNPLPRRGGRQPMPADFELPAAPSYYLSEGKAYTDGNTTDNGSLVKPATLRGYGVVNSRQKIRFTLDPSARLTVASVRARETAQGWYEASASCRPVLTDPFGVNFRRLCNSFVERVEFKDSRLISRFLGKTISVMDASAPQTLELKVEDELSGPQGPQVRVTLTVNGQTEVMTDLIGSQGNPLFNKAGKVGFMIQGFQSQRGQTTNTAVEAYEFNYLPHANGHFFYTGATGSRGLIAASAPLLQPAEIAQNLAFRTALPSESLPGFFPIFILYNPNVARPVNGPLLRDAYLTQNRGEFDYLRGLGYINYGSLGQARPLATCVGSGLEIKHRYHEVSGKHVFSSNPSVIATETDAPRWVTHTSLGCSLP